MSNLDGKKKKKEHAAGKPREGELNSIRTGHQQNTRAVSGTRKEEKTAVALLRGRGQYGGAGGRGKLGGIGTQWGGATP